MWYLEFLLLLTPPLVFLDDDGIRYDWPITLTSGSTKPTFSPVSDQITAFELRGRSDAEVTSSGQTLSFEDSTLGRRLLQTLHNLVYIGLILFVTGHLKQIFSGFSKNQPFAGNNAARIKWMAFSVLFLVFFDVLEDILHRLYTTSTIRLSGATFDEYPFHFDFRTFTLGLLLLILAEVFRQGYEYQTDSESIL
ncbi:hypothetical protein ACO2Q8_01770 [Larkinella sp. VNQ87]|uniref:hypothetical protein n=1 Tax=Larkinella sp. VNQ87 TaxID=3400921 RepID=UPI003BFE70AF